MRKFFALISLIIVVLTISGCTKTESLEINDPLGVTTFSYNKDSGFEIVKIDTENGAHTAVILKNEKKNFELEMYYFENNPLVYKESIEHRKDNDYYKEYTWNGYSGYTFSSGDNIRFNIFLKEDSVKNLDIILFGEMERIDSSDKTSIVEIFNSKEMQDFLNTIKFN